MSKPIRLGVIFDQCVHAGGGYQQALNAALQTRLLPKALVETIFFTTIFENIQTLSGYGINAHYLKLSFFDKLLMRLRNKDVPTLLTKALKWVCPHGAFEKHLISSQIDLVYFLSPNPLANSLEGLNYITTVWDLCHLDCPEFPEVRQNRELETRERNYKEILIRATAIFVDSEVGKSNVVHRYGIDTERVYVTPFQAALETRVSSKSKAEAAYCVRNRYDLDVPYVFYPAQFWAHKNHAYLLEGLCALEQLHGYKIGAVFSGVDKGNRAYVETQVRILGLENRVRFAGFVSNEEIPELYIQSVALVMPTYFGPTNLPPLEAFELDVPVLYSDKPGLRDQVGEAALLMDLTNPTSMANHLKNLIENSALRESLVQAGRARLKYFDSMHSPGVLERVITEFSSKKFSWG